MNRKTPHVTNEIYHIYDRSIAKFKIFNHPNEQNRMLQLLEYYHMEDKHRPAFSIYRRDLGVQKKGPRNACNLEGYRTPLVRILAFCLMETHYHLALQQTAPNGISIFMQHVMTAYSKFFNALHKRKGPLTESRYQSRHVATNEYLLHLTRYIHLNPVKAKLCAKPEDWGFSSYRKYIGQTSSASFCDYKSLIPYSHSDYQKITEDHADYQASLEIIKDLLLDEDGA